MCIYFSRGFCVRRLWKEILLQDTKVPSNEDFVSLKRLSATKHKEEGKMESLKQEAIVAISRMSDSAEIDDIMYRLYVIDKVRKGQTAVKAGDTVSIEELREEIERW